MHTSIVVGTACPHGDVERSRGAAPAAFSPGTFGRPVIASELEEDYSSSGDGDFRAVSGVAVAGFPPTT